MDARNAEKRVEGVRTRAEGIGQNLTRVQKRLEQRGANIDFFRDALKGVAPPDKGRVFIRYVEGSTEAYGFASSLWFVLRLTMDWPVPSPAGEPSFAVPNGGVIASCEVAIVVPDADWDNRSEYAKAFWDAFLKMGYDKGGLCGARDETLPPGSVAIFFGPKVM
jgi:hypothetical protein